MSPPRALGAVGGAVALVVDRGRRLAPYLQASAAGQRLAREASEVVASDGLKPRGFNAASNFYGSCTVTSTCMPLKRARYCPSVEESPPEPAMDM